MPRPKSKRPKKRLNLEISQATSERLERLLLLMDADSRTEVVRLALEIVETLCENVDKDGLVSVQGKNDRAIAVLFGSHTRKAIDAEKAEEMK